jgi:hypothetical protein
MWHCAIAEASRSLEVQMRRWKFVVPGVVLVIAGAVFTLQGLNLLGQSGGMNGRTLWAVVGPIIALVGLGLVTIGARAGRSAEIS